MKKRKGGAIAKAGVFDSQPPWTMRRLAGVPRLAH